MTDRRILLIDDHPPIREGIAAVIQNATGFAVVGAAGTYRDGLREVRRQRPDIVILDLSLPDANGIDLIRSIVSELPAVLIMVLTMHARRHVADRAFDAGAHGYLLKESTGELLVKGLQELVSGKRVLDPRLMSEEVPDGCSDNWAGAASTVRTLTPRELDVFRLLVLGKSGKQIGAVLGISPKTVDNHRANLMRKLCVESIAELVRIAIRTGIIEP